MYLHQNVYTHRFRIYSWDLLCVDSDSWIKHARTTEAPFHPRRLKQWIIFQFWFSILLQARCLCSTLPSRAPFSSILPISKEVAIWDCLKMESGWRAQPCKIKIWKSKKIREELLQVDSSSFCLVKATLFVLTGGSRWWWASVHQTRKPNEHRNLNKTDAVGGIRRIELIRFNQKECWGSSKNTWIPSWSSCSGMCQQGCILDELQWASTGPAAGKKLHNMVY